MCQVLASLTTAVAALADLPDPVGLGAEEVLADQVAVLSRSMAAIQRELALRMAGWEARPTRAPDVRGEAVRAGIARSQAAHLRRLGKFAEQHPSVREAWEAGDATSEQVWIVSEGARKLNTPAQLEQLLALVLPHLPSVDAAGTRALVELTVDAINPGDPDLKELSDHAHRSLVWSRYRGGINLTGYLPEVEAGAFTSAIDALAESVRVEGDRVTPAQRRADALAQLVAIAAARGLPTGGGLPAAVTVTVPIGEVDRIAAKDPADHGFQNAIRPRGPANINGRPAGDAAVRFGICCAPLTPVATRTSQPGSLLDKISRTPVEPLVVGRAVRLATRAQRKALAIRDQGCVMPGCTVATPYTQPHHVIPFHTGGATDQENLASLCFVHHRAVELGRWILQRRRPDDIKPDGALEHPAWWILRRL